jgi:hypothetical protein
MITTFTLYAEDTKVAEFDVIGQNWVNGYGTADMLAKRYDADNMVVTHRSE